MHHQRKIIVINGAASVLAGREIACSESQPGLACFVDAPERCAPSPRCEAPPANATRARAAVRRRKSAHPDSLAAVALRERAFFATERAMGRRATVLPDELTVALCRAGAPSSSSHAGTTAASNAAVGPEVTTAGSVPKPTFTVK